MANVAIQPQMDSVPISDLTLDEENPRIARALDMYGGQVTAEQMALALGAGDQTEGDSSSTTFRSLKESIKANGGVIHPIIVNREGDGKLVVVEGNTRALIYQEFQKDGVPGNWGTIPALVYPNISDQEKDAIRLQAHLVGPRPWDPYSKAKYLHFLSTSMRVPMNELIEFCGGRRQEVQNFIGAYKDMEEHYRPILDSDQDFDHTRFSAFAELQKRSIGEAVQKAGFTKSNFASWVHQGKIAPLMSVRHLPRILVHAEAKQAFLDNGTREAQKIIDAPSPSEVLGSASLTELAQEVIQRIQTMEYGELRRLRANVDSVENLVLCDARDALVDLCRDIVSEE